jgi:hypothetical protein
VFVCLNIFQHILLSYAPTLAAAADLPYIQMMLGDQPRHNRRNESVRAFQRLSV